MVFLCEICDLEAPSYQHYFYHSVQMHDKKMWACKYCDHITTKKAKVFRHTRGRHLDELSSPDEPLEDYFEEQATCATSPNQLLCYFQQQIDQSFKCVFCAEGVPSKDQLSQHLLLQHTPSQFILEKVSPMVEDSSLFFCKLCQATSSGLELLAEHILSCHPINIFSAKSICSFEGIEDLEALKFKCDECPYATFVLGNFERHIKRHAEKLTYYCDLCSMSSDHKKILQKHKKRWHAEKGSPLKRLNEDVSEELQCTICTDKMYKSKRTLKRHMTIKHSRIETHACDHEASREALLSKELSIFRCEFCNLEFQLFESLASHCTSFHKKTALCLSCEQCSFATNQVSILTSHIALHNKPQLRDSRNKYSSRHHALVKNPDKVFECPTCHKEMRGWSCYMRHRKRHVLKHEQVLKCQLCPFVANSVSLFRMHKSTHSRPLYKHLLVCDECPYRAQDSGHLERHQRAHKRSNCSHMCPHCSYACSYASLLRRHMHVHSVLYACKFSRASEASQEGETQMGGGDVQREIEDCVQSAIKKSRLVALKSISSDANRLSDRQAVLHCERCPFRSASVETFEKHTSLHFHKRPFQCVYCDYSVPTFAYLLIHRGLHHQGNKNLLYTQCIDSLQQLPAAQAPEECIEHLGSMYELSGHFRFEPLKLFSCDSCPFTCADRASFRLHLAGHEAHHSFKCVFCSFSCACRSDLLAHLELHFSIPGRHHASQASKEAFLTQILQQFPCVEVEDAVKEGRLEEVRSDEVCEGFLECKYCSRQFDVPSHLAAHQSMHLRHSSYLSGAAL